MRLLDTESPFSLFYWFFLLFFLFCTHPAIALFSFLFSFSSPLPNANDPQFEFSSDTLYRFFLRPHPPGEEPHHRDPPVVLPNAHGPPGSKLDLDAPCSATYRKKEARRHPHSATSRTSHARRSNEHSAGPCFAAWTQSRVPALETHVEGGPQIQRTEGGDGQCLGLTGPPSPAERVAPRRKLCHDPKRAGCGAFTPPTAVMRGPVGEGSSFSMWAFSIFLFSSAFKWLQGVHVERCIGAK